MPLGSLRENRSQRKLGHCTMLAPFSVNFALVVQKYSQSPAGTEGRGVVTSVHRLPG